MYRLWSLNKFKARQDSFIASGWFKYHCIHIMVTENPNEVKYHTMENFQIQPMLPEKEKEGFSYCDRIFQICWHFNNTIKGIKVINFSLYILQDMVHCSLNSLIMFIHLANDILIYNQISIMNHCSWWGFQKYVLIQCNDFLQGGILNGRDETITCMRSNIRA